MLTQIAQAKRPQERFGNGVSEDIGIRMTEKTALGSDLYAAHDQGATGGPGMNVKPQSDPDHPNGGALAARARARKMAVASVKSAGVVSLRFSGNPGTSRTG